MLGLIPCHLRLEKQCILVVHVYDLILMLHINLCFLYKCDLTFVSIMYVVQCVVLQCAMNFHFVIIPNHCPLWSVVF